MSQANEPPLALESWTIVGKLNDGTDITLEPDDLRKSLQYEIEEAISSWYERLNLHRDKMMASEVEIAKVCKSTSVNVRTAANHLGEGLARLEKTCNFDRLERHVELLERASVAMLSLSELEKNGRLEKIMDAMK